MRNSGGQGNTIGSKKAKQSKEQQQKQSTVLHQIPFFDFSLNWLLILQGQKTNCFAFTTLSLWHSYCEVKTIVSHTCSYSPFLSILSLVYFPQRPPLLFFLRFERGKAAFFWWPPVVEGLLMLADLMFYPHRGPLEQPMMICALVCTKIIAWTKRNHVSQERVWRSEEGYNFI